MTFLIRMIFKFVTKISLMTCCISEKGSLILSCSWSFLILGKRDLLHKFESVVQLRTIFIAGLPDDVKERELLNLLRWLPGYEASQVNFKGEKPMGFALFSTAQFAMAAKDTLQVCLLLIIVDSDPFLSSHYDICCSWHAAYGV